MALLIIGILWLFALGWFWRRQVGGRRRGALWTPTADLLAGGILFWLTLGFFWRTLSGDVYQPADGGDLVSFLYPTYRFAARTLGQSVLPLWNPHLYGGAPFISDIQAGFFYPPNLLLFWLDPDFDYRVLQWYAIGHIYWAGLGMFVLLRTLHWGERGSVSRPAAIFGALAFALSDPFLTHLGNLNLIAVLSWMPWVLAAFHRSLPDRGESPIHPGESTTRPYWAAVAAVLFALGNYAGHAQSSFYIGLAIGLYTLFWAGVTGGDRRAEYQAAQQLTVLPRRLLAHLQSLVIVVVLTGLLTAPILLPALAHTRHTLRGGFTYQDTVAFSLAPAQVIGLLTPGFFGHGPALHWGLWERVETPYAGVATLIFAGAALALAPAGRTPWARRRLWPWLGLAAFGFVTALGVYAILHGWLTLFLPGFDQLRAPARALVLWTLGLAVLAAVGLDRVQNLRHERRFIQNSPLQSFLKTGALILAGVFTPLLFVTLLLTQQDPTAFLRASVATLAITLAAGCWLGAWLLIRAYGAGWFNEGALAVLAVLLLYFDLSAAGAYTDISPADPTRGYQHPEIVNFLNGDPDHFRIDTRTDIEDLWQPNAAALHGLEDVWGVANPLILRRWIELVEATGGRHTRLYDMLNVKYVIVRDGTPLPDGKFELAFDASGELAVYRNLNAMPRAWLVHSARAEADEEAILAALRSGDFDPTQTVLIQNGSPLPSPDAPTTGNDNDRVTIEKASVNKITVRAWSSAPGYLVLSEVWYPGWRATVNGLPADVLQANYALRTVPVPGGESTIHLWFTPPGWRAGLVAFAIGIIAFIALAVQQR